MMEAEAHVALASTLRALLDQSLAARGSGEGVAATTHATTTPTTSTKSHDTTTACCSTSAATTSPSNMYTRKEVDAMLAAGMSLLALLFVGYDQLCDFVHLTLVHLASWNFSLSVFFFFFFFLFFFFYFFFFFLLQQVVLLCITNVVFTM